MAEVTKEDIAEVHKRIDLVNVTMTEVKVSMAEIKTTLSFQPKMPDRPCEYQVDLKKDFDGHLDDHKETKKTWQKPIVRTVIDLVKMAIVALVTWLFLRKN